MTDGKIGGVETILEIGAEGGSITLKGRRDSSGAWQFQVNTNEAALWDLLEEGAPDSTSAAAGLEETWIDSWDGALSDLNRSPWPKLWPLVVHPDFAPAILAAVTAHEGIGPKEINRWRAFMASSRSRPIP